MRKKSKKIAILMLSIMMLLSQMQVVALAADLQNDTNSYEQESDNFEPLKVNFINEIKEVSVGDKISLELDATGGSGGYEYSFYKREVIEEESSVDDLDKEHKETSENVSNNTEDKDDINKDYGTLLQDYGQENVFELPCDNPGEWVIFGLVKDSEGNEAETEINLTIVPKDVDENVDIDDSSDKGDDVDKDSSQDEPKDAIDDEQDGTAAFIAPRTDSSLTVNLTCNRTQYTYVDRGTVFTASGRGGSGGYQYKYSEVYNGKTKVLRDFSTSSEYSFYTEKLGTHLYSVEVKDSTGNIAKASFEMIVVTHPDYELKADLTCNRTSTEYIDRGTVFTVNVMQGYGQYEYQFEEIYNGQTRMLREYSASNEYSFYTSELGVHEYHIKVRDKSGAILEKVFKMTVIAHPDYKLAAEIKCNRTPTEYLDRGTVFTVNVTQGYGEYQYRFTELFNGTTRVLRDYSASNEYSFYTSEVGKHVYYFEIKDRTGAVIKESYTMNVIQHPDMKLSAQVSCNRTATEYLDRGTVFTVNATSGYGDYQYRFTETYKGKTKVLRDFSTWNEYSFYTSELGVHEYLFEIKDRSGEVIKKTFTMTVIQHPDNILDAEVTCNRTATEYMDRGTVFTVNAKSGYGDYQYKFTEVFNGKTKVLRDYSAWNEYSFYTSEVGKHEYYFEVKDRMGVVVKKSFTMTVIQHPDNILDAEIICNRTATEYVDRGTVFTVNAKSGYGDYQYRFTEVFNGKTKVLRDYSTWNEYSFYTSEIGKHVYYIEVKDRSGAVVKKSFTMTVVQHPDYKLTAELKCNRTSMEYPDRGTVFTVNVLKGYGDYQYRFTEVYNGKTNVLRSYGTWNEYSFYTSGYGTHVYYAEVKDRSGAVVKLSYTIKVVPQSNKGVDVSAYQGKINWSSVKSDGISFAMLRVIEGSNINTMKVDSTFNYNIKNATANGISVGGYRYGYAVTTTQAIQEAKAVADAIEASGCRVTYPIAYDVEGEAQGKLSRSQLVAVIKAFKTTIEHRGYKFMIYANLNWLNNKIDMNQFSGEDVWIAQYRDYTPNLGHQYTGPGKVTIWQYSDRGRVAGISENVVDMNIGYKFY